jgi:hypothetical protein
VTAKRQYEAKAGVASAPIDPGKFSEEAAAQAKKTNKHVPLYLLRYFSEPPAKLYIQAKPVA